MDWLWIKAPAESSWRTEGEGEESASHSVRTAGAAKQDGYWGQNDTLWTDDSDPSVGQPGSTRGMDDLTQEGNRDLGCPFPIPLEIWKRLMNT